MKHISIIIKMTMSPEIHYDVFFETSTAASSSDLELIPQKDNSLQLSISLAIEQLLSENRKQKYYTSKIREQSKMIFSSSTIPKISILEYLNRIVNYTKIEDSTLITSIIYLDSVTQNGIYLTDYNIHTLLLICILIAIKMNEDDIYTNDYYAEVAGISLKKLNKIEHEFLNMNKFKLFVDKDIFEQYQRYLSNFYLNTKIYG